jgi:tRNA(Arg) A34 adenosine deaminase TadA
MERHLIQGCTMYVYREGKDKCLKICKPCKTCMALMKEYGVKKVYYTTNNGVESIKL